MNITGKWIVVSCLPIMFSCAAGVKTKYEKETDFREYQTYALMPKPEKKFEYLTNPEHVRLKIDEKVVNSIKMQFRRKAYEENTESPDFLVAYHTGVYDKVSVLDWGYNYPREIRYLDGREDIELHYYKEGSLVIDFVDANTKELIWRGALKRILEPGNLEERKVKERIDNAVERILEKFPPSK